MTATDSTLCVYIHMYIYKYMHVYIYMCVYYVYIYIHIISGNRTFKRITAMPPHGNIRGSFSLLLETFGLN